MHVYFVRHGETVLNKRKIHQSPNTPLSPKGKMQAETVAEYLRGMNPDCILTSEYTRAQETAGVIGMRTGLTPTRSGLFYEIERPSSLYHVSHFHVRTILYVVLSIVHRKNKSWRYQDAENYTDILARAHKAVTYLESLAPAHQSVVVVSHTVFINCMVAVLCNESALTLKNLWSMALGIIRLRNTGVTHLEYIESSKKGTCAWRRIESI